tara:strand:- start:2913 stop:3590 length:678 start_codon:yes stop_codon:yes gene_type:complete
MKVLTISLLKDGDRRSRFLEQFQSEGISFSFVDAVDGRSATTKEYYNHAANENYLFNRRWIISPSEYGCKASHQKALEEFIYNSDEEFLLVCEDDITIDSSLKKFIKKLEGESSSLSEDDLVIHLGGQDGLANSRRLIKFSQKVIANREVFKVFPLTLRWLYRTCAYVVNRSAAQKILAVHQKHNFVVDDWAFIRKRTGISNIYFCDIVRHPDELLNSNIESERQ